VKSVDGRVERRLRQESNVWVATVRPDGRPHLTPVWFAWHAGRLYICIDPNSVKARNLAHNPHMAMALENGSDPTILEGTGRQLNVADVPAEVVAEFKRKYDWDIRADRQYRRVIETAPTKVLSWSSAS